ncbi:J domain-containing protein [Arthrobacter sp. 49Tsu3.1M3]|uniref:J domain-containing protein n=1 Tax=Arthrobacter sp. 49Tsu3.1M3 TaxID=1279029 RepID=UPI001177A600|nr:J domain-containing protein [Arthrobacter sp. 49Tsu3.1M3]
MTEHNPDPYKVLHLARTASARDIGRAYRALVRTRHPDIRHAGAAPAGPDSTAHEQRERQERQDQQELQEIMDAYAVLGDPARRAVYDRQRPKTPPPKPAPPHRDPGPAGPALIIGPVRWESLIRPGTPAPGRRLLWWIRF